jgi:hypothetical protein
MLTTVTLWTLMIWAEPKRSTQALSVASITGFVSERSCQAARERIVMENATRTGRGSGETGIDIKLITCVPVVHERLSP